MDLYGDLPPAQGEYSSKPSARFGPESAAATDPQSKTKLFPKIPASLAFKPRQATQLSQSRPNSEKTLPVMQKPTGRVEPVIVQPSTTAGVYTSSIAVVDTKNQPKEEFNTNSSFDVEAAYDPSRPNDYIAYCSERLERRKQARVQEENVRRMDEADRAREALEKERREAAQRGDYQSLLSSASSMSAGIGVEAEGSAALGRGRGRGRGLVNLPAWMTQQQYAEPAAPTAPTSAQSLNQVPTGQKFQDAAAVGMVVGIKRKQGANKPSCVLLLKNMVAAADVDEQLAAETQQECLKYGTVEHCVVHTVPAQCEAVRCPEEERVRTFVYFQSQESAVRAFR